MQTVRSLWICLALTAALGFGLFVLIICKIISKLTKANDEEDEDDFNEIYSLIWLFFSIISNTITASISLV